MVRVRGVVVMGKAGSRGIVCVNDRNVSVCEGKRVFL